MDRFLLAQRKSKTCASNFLLLETVTAHVEGEGRVQGFGGETGGKENTGETQAQMGG